MLIKKHYLLLETQVMKPTSVFLIKKRV